MFKVFLIGFLGLVALELPEFAIPITILVLFAVLIEAIEDGRPHR